MQNNSSLTAILFSAIAPYLIGVGLVIGLSIAPLAPAKASPVSANILVDSASGAVLEAHNADKITYPASLTKMMTLYVLFSELKQKKIKLTNQIQVSKSAAHKSATNLNLKGGEKIPVETAILALVVRSANDIAAAIAERISGSESAFALRMNAAAKKIGMTKTKFYNASGLPDTRQITTARDMAILGIALLNDFPQFYHYFSADRFTYRGVTYTSHNRVTRNYDGADGIKTGYIRLSGFNLVTSASRNGRRLVGAVLGGESSFARDRQMTTMLDRGFGKNLAAMKDSLKVKPPVDDQGVAEISIAQVDAEVITRGSQPHQNGGTDEFDIVSQTLRSFEADQAPPAPASDRPAPKNIVAEKKPTTPVKSANSSKTGSSAQQSAAIVSNRSTYGIQVGAYNEYAPARKAALRAARAVKQKQTDIVIEQAQNGGTPLFRARIAGLSKKEAESACRSLKRKGSSCFIVLSPDSVASRN